MAVAGLVLLALVLPPTSSATRYLHACKGYPWMDNVPRGSMLAASNTLCVVRRAHHRYLAYDYINPPHQITLAARLRVRLTYHGHMLARSREYVTPETPVFIKTAWRHQRRGRFCAELWNHDGLGHYRVERACHRL